MSLNLQKSGALVIGAILLTMLCGGCGGSQTSDENSDTAAARDPQKLEAKKDELLKRNPPPTPQ